MTAGTLSTVCGTILSIVSLAQTNTTQDRTRDTDRQGHNRTTMQDGGAGRSTDPQRGANSANIASAESVLRDMEGVWKVDVRINPAAWSHMGGDKSNKMKQDRPSGSDARRTTTTDKDRPSSERDSGSTSDPDAPHDLEKETDDHGRTDQGRKKIQTNTTMREVQPGESQFSKTSFSGYAQTKRVLGENVLQETIVLPDMKQKMPGGSKTDDRRTASDDSLSEDNDFRGITMLTFDEHSNTYSIAFVDNCSGRIFHDTGTYDASSRRIVFNGKDVGERGNSGMNRDSGASNTDASRNRRDGATTSGNTNNNRNTTDSGENRTTTDNNTDRTTTSNNRNTTNNNTNRTTTDNNRSTTDANTGADRPQAHYHDDGAGYHGSRDMDDVRVVLELIGKNQYRATMYKVSPDEAAGWTPPGNTAQNRTLPADDANAQAPEVTGNVVYVATYTRAEGSERVQYERMLDEALTQAE